MNTGIWKRYITILILLTMLFRASAIINSEMTRLDADLYTELIGWENKRLFEEGSRYLDSEIKDTALVYFSILCGKYDLKLPIDDQKLIAESYNKCATIHYYYYNYLKALEMYIKGMEICERIDYKECEAKILNNIGNVYFEFKDYTNANMYYEKAYNGLMKIGKSEYVIVPLSNLIGVCCCLGLNDKANEYIAKAKEFNKGDNFQTDYSIWTSMGSINIDMRRYDSALYCFRRSLLIVNNRGKTDYGRLCNSLYNIASVYKLSNNYDSAIYYLEQGNLIASKHRIDKKMASNYEGLSEIYEAKGEYKKALFYKGKYLRIYDSIYNVTEYGKIKEIPFLYEIDKIDKQMMALNVEKEISYHKMRTQRLVLYVVVVGLFIILVLLFIVYGQKSKVVQMYKDLFNRNIDIMKSEVYNKDLRIKYEEIIKLKNEELSKYTDVSSGIKCGIEHNDDIQEGRIKYQSSSLSEEQKSALKGVIDEIMEHTEVFVDSDISLDRLAEMANSNTRYVSQIINEFYGKNFSAFVNEYRIREARKLLASPEYRNYTIEAISLKVGFKSKASFNVTFKKLTGLIPSDYQKMAKNGINSSK